MKKYEVRLEFNIKSTDFANITVEANSQEEARKLAKKDYFNGNTDLDYYAGESIDTSLDTYYELDWNVTELDDYGITDLSENSVKGR